MRGSPNNSLQDAGGIDRKNVAYPEKQRSLVPPGRLDLLGFQTKTQVVGRATVLGDKVEAAFGARSALVHHLEHQNIYAIPNPLGVPVGRIPTIFFDFCVFSVTMVRKPDFVRWKDFCQKMGHFK
jgi:hypothetical protein